MMLRFFSVSAQKTAALEQKEKDHFDASKYSWKVRRCLKPHLGQMYRQTRTYSPANIV